MSDRGWTAAELQALPLPYRGAIWRVVENQARAATMRLASSLQAQLLLEQEIEAAKPPWAEGTERLHYLLATPFRYPPSPYGSRFRGPYDPGVFYGAERLTSAAAEAGYWRWRFLLDNDGLDQLPPIAHTAFQALVVSQTLDLTRPPLDRDTALWSHPDNYQPCQAFALAARAAAIGAIRYASVRDPEAGPCLAVLDPTGLAKPKPLLEKQIFLTVRADIVLAQLGERDLELDMRPWLGPQS